MQVGGDDGCGPFRRRISGEQSEMQPYAHKHKIRQGASCEMCAAGVHSGKMRTRRAYSGARFGGSTLNAEMPLPESCMIFCILHVVPMRTRGSTNSFCV